MCGTTARLTRKTPRTLTRITCSHCSTVVSSTSPTPLIPALFTRTSMRPKRSRVAAASARVCSSSATSTCRATASPPASATSCATRAAEASSTSAIVTRPPSRAKISAVVRPIPEPAPVTMQAFPARRTSASLRADDAGEGQGDEDDGTVCRVDPEGLDLREREDVLDEREQNHPGERADDPSAAALERDAADDRRREDGEDEVVALIRRHRDDLAGRHEARHGGEEAADHEDAHPDAVDLDPCRPRRFHVAAAGVDRAAHPVVAEEEAGNQEDGRRHPDRDRDPVPGGRPEIDVGVGHGVDGPAAHDPDLKAG